MKYYLIGFLFLFSHLLYSKTIYTTSLKVKKTSNYDVDIAFKCNTNRGHFQVYQLNGKKIINTQDIKKAKLIFDQNLNGKKSRSLFLFNLTDFFDHSGEYYYFVRYGTNEIQVSDISPGFNSMLQPLVVKENIKTDNIKQDKIKKITKEEVIKVSKISAEIQDGKIRIFWDLNKIPVDKISFRFYRLITNEPASNCLKREADARIEDDFFYEDTTVLSTMFYRYVVLFGTNSVIEEGRNLTTKGLWIEPTLSKPKVEKERLYETVILKFDQTNQTDPPKKFCYLLKSQTNQIYKKGIIRLKQSTITNQKVIIKRK